MALRDKSRKGKKDKLAEGHKAPFRTDPRSESNVDLFGRVTDPTPSFDLTQGQHVWRSTVFENTGDVRALEFLCN